MKVYRCRFCGEAYLTAEKPRGCPFCGAHEHYVVKANDWKILDSETLSDITRDKLQKALDLEIDNVNFYRAASEKGRDIYVTSLFRGLSKVEREHASAICKLLKIEKPDSKAGLNKASNLDSANLKEANKREKRAVGFYEDARSKVPEGDMKQFFKVLIEIESDHITLTERK